ncbi:GSCOCG00006037001-RA-CDS [Cotesia congregata]|nr:GSCOCG00006037001-RA-CDS [Cotesia congregata]
MPMAQENNVEETAVEDFDNSDQEFIIEEEFTIEETPIFCDLQYEHKVSTSMTPEENHEMTSGNDVGSSDQEIIIEEEIVINDFNDDVQSENSVSIPAAVDNAYNSGQESFSNKSDDLQNEDILPALLNFMDNNSITVLDNTDCLDTEKDLNKFIDEVSSENIFAIPITPEKSNHGSSEKSDHVFITPVKRLNKNSINDLTPLSLEGLNSDDEYDKLCNEKFLNPSHNFQQRSIRSDSEYERMCEVIPNNSMEEAKFNYETSDLLNFNDIDQSTNDKLADLLKPLETNSRSGKNQDYMITIDPLIDHSTSGGSLSDISDESDLGIEVKSRHIKKMIKKNAERKKFFKIQKKSHSAQSSNSVVENEDKCTEETRYRTRRKRLRSNGSINYNEDTGDSLDDNLRKKVNKPKVKRTKKSYSNIEGRRSSRLLKKSTNKENSQDGKGDCVNNVNSVNNGKKLPVIRLRRINSLKPQDSNNQENGEISKKNPENYVWAMNFDGSFNENDQSSFKDNQILNSNDMIAEVNESVTTKFFSDEENQRSYNQLTNLSLMNIDDHLSEKLLTNDVVNTRTELLDGKSNDKNRENNDENTTNLDSLAKTNLKLEKEEIFSPISRELLHKSSPCEKEPSVEFGEQPCNEIQENMDVGQPAEETMTECRLQDTSFVGRQIKIGEKMKEYLNDTYQSDVDGNVVSSSTEKCCTEKSPTKLKVHNNSKSPNVPTSSNDNKLIESESELSDANNNHDSDFSDPSFCRMSEKSNDSESTNPDEIDGSKKKLMKKLMFLKVKLEHKVPKQHQLERNTADPITPKLRAEFRKYAELQTGQFTAEENEILRRNWDRFCEVHKLDPSCVTLLLQKYDPAKSLIGYMKDRTKLLQFLARDLPNRLLNKVYRRFRYLYAEGEKIKQKPNIHQFLVKEDRMIMNYMNDEDKPDDEKNLNKLAEKFIKEFMDLTLTEDIEELRYARIPHCIWIEMEKKLKLPKLKLKKFWFHQLHIMLIEYLYVKGISSRDQIDWSVVAEHFDNYITSESLTKIFTILLSRVPIKDEEKNLLDCIEWMYENKIPEITEARYDYQLPRLAYKDGKLEIIDDYCNGNGSELSSD